jgi:hypothetical protein
LRRSVRGFNVISAYASLVWLAEHLKVKYWEDLEGLCQDIQREKIFQGDDLNGHVGRVSRGFKGLHNGMTLGSLMLKVILFSISRRLLIVLKLIRASRKRGVSYHIQ